LDRDKPCPYIFNIFPVGTTPEINLPCPEINSG